MAAADDPLEKLSHDQKESLVELVDRYENSKMSRRGAMGLLAGIGIGGAAGAIGVDAASAGASTSDSDGNVGTPSDPVDVFADGADLATELGVPVYQSTSDVPSQQEGALVFIQDDNSLYVEDGT